ncbi:deoxyribonuclease-1 isoform X7 [Pteropus vampyrus]|uniref:Deoxyribonuclease-1 n=1 Tax=Pteropus vampyrus TaxID=132908 RepID=A0A6P3RC01_PTEVA|nr:deoxyribonuclease-1 isoform X7 [Pteropus vampyrus]
MEAKIGVMQPQAKNTRSLQKLKSKGRKYRGTSTPDSAESPSLQKSHFRDDPNTYHYVVSEPLGRNSYKERYLFVFRPDQVSAMDSYQYDDGCEPCGNDTFSREPAIVKFFSPFTQIKEFAIVPLHAAPSDAVAEIDSLYDVYLDVRKKWDIEDIMLMGDFNAGCSYVSPSHWSSIRLRTSPAFQWLIPDTADTTVKSTHCAYDRIVVAGTLLQHAIVPNSAVPFDFQAAYGLSDQTLKCNVTAVSIPGRSCLMRTEERQQAGHLDPDATSLDVT